MTHDDAAATIAALNLKPHPEGGHYRETIRLSAAVGARSPMTAILYLLAAGERSHWHRVDAAELWLWHAGAPLALGIAEEGTAAVHDLCATAPQRMVPPHAWQSARTRGDWTLVTCVVTPGFDFAGFELAPPGWSPEVTRC